MSVFTCSFFFFNDTATTEIYTLSLHDALPISADTPFSFDLNVADPNVQAYLRAALDDGTLGLVVTGLLPAAQQNADRKSTRLNSSHANISYAVFCLKKKHIKLML